MSDKSRTIAWRWYDWLAVAGVGFSGIGFIGRFTPEDGAVALLFPAGLFMLWLSALAARKWG